MKRTEQIIRTCLPRTKLKSLSELAERTGIPKATLCRKMQQSDNLTKREIRLMAIKTNMGKDDVYALIMAED